MTKKPFLATTWSHLAILNYEVNPAVLEPLVPRGTELDDFHGRYLVSMVGFLYTGTRVFGLAIPGHRNFPEVNLRFYVRYKADDKWRRGVAFVKEIVPRRAVAWIARKLYDENFVALPMSFNAVETGSGTRIEYSWQHSGYWSRLGITAAGRPQLPSKGSEEEFITEHYWGYTARQDGRTSEYRVDHPQWRVTRASDCWLDCDVANIYGDTFAPYLIPYPHSAFLAEGSRVAVYMGTDLQPITESH